MYYYGAISSKLEISLNKIYSRYYSDVRMIKEFTENIDKLLTCRQEIILKNISNLSNEEKKQLIIFAKLISNAKKNPDREKEITDTTDTITKSKPPKITLKVSSKVGDFLVGYFDPAKQKNFLSEMALVYLISYQEAFIKDYVKNILIARRDILKSKKTLNFTFEEICDLNSMDSLIERMVQEEVDKNFDGGIDDFADYFDNRFDLPIEKEFLDWETVKEASYRRNIIVHNRGRTNKKYCSKTGHRKTNEHLKTDSAYVQNATNAVLSFIDFIHSRMCEKLGLSQPKLSDK